MVAMSGGVDSSVVAGILASQGYTGETPLALSPVPMLISLSSFGRSRPRTAAMRSADFFILE